MTLIILVYLGGMLSILSPCILPVIPFVFARGGLPFGRSGLPLLAGMVLTFAAVASLAGVAGTWAAEANQYGRFIALAVMALFAITLMSERCAALLARPLVRIGARLSGSAQRTSSHASVASSVLLGIATGFLWAPCAGPILGLVLATAALKGTSVGTTLLLAAYGAGAASALAVALLASRPLIGLMKRHLDAGVWLRRGVGVAVLATVAAIATGIDTDVLSNVNTVDTAPIEQRLIDGLGSPAATPGKGAASRQAATDRLTALIGRDSGLPVVPGAYTGAGEAFRPAKLDLVAATEDLSSDGALPSLGGATEWINSAPLSAQALRGRVVLVNIWTYACINCRHVLPHVKAWAAKYRDAGLVVVGVHTPELAFERVTDNVKDAVRRYGITYPVAVDTHSAIWNSFNNEFWPANYFADTKGRLRYHHFGEGDYQHQEDVIRQLLRDAGAENLPGGYVSLGGDGTRFAANDAQP